MVLTSKWGRIQPEIQIWHVQVTWRCVAVRELPEDVLKMASGLILPSALAGHRRQLCIERIKVYSPFRRCPQCWPWPPDTPHPWSQPPSHPDCSEADVLKHPVNSKWANKYIKTPCNFTYPFFSHFVILNLNGVVREKIWNFYLNFYWTFYPKSIASFSDFLI